MKCYPFVSGYYSYLFEDGNCIIINKVLREVVRGVKCCRSVSLYLGTKANDCEVFSGLNLNVVFAFPSIIRSTLPSCHGNRFKLLKVMM